MHWQLHQCIANSNCTSARATLKNTVWLSSSCHVMPRIWIRDQVAGKNLWLKQQGFPSICQENASLHVVHACMLPDGIVNPWMQGSSRTAGSEKPAFRAGVTMSTPENNVVQLMCWTLAGLVACICSVRNGAKLAPCHSHPPAGRFYGDLLLDVSALHEAL